MGYALTKGGANGEESEEDSQEKEEVVFVLFYDSLSRRCGSEPFLVLESVADSRAHTRLAPSSDVGI